MRRIGWEGDDNYNDMAKYSLIADRSGTDNYHICDIC